MVTGHEYIFSYMTNKNSVMYDGMNLNIKRGPFNKKSIPFQSIVNWYVYEDKTYRSMFITWMAENGKQKKIQLFAQLGEPGFADLVTGFNQIIGNKGLNHLDKKEAFKIMKAANPKTVGAVGAMVVIFILTTVFMFPGLCHYFDHGFEHKTVDELIAGDYDSRNLEIEGYPFEETLEETYTKNSTTTKTYYVPIVGDNWSEGDPIPVILKFNESDYDDMGGSKYVGVVRNIWFEGVDSDVKEFFENNYSFTVSDDVILFEATGEEHNDSMMFFIWCLINGIFILIFGIMYIRNK